MANENLNILINVLKGQSETALKGIQNQIVGIGAAYLSWQGAKSIIQGTIGAAIESERVWAGVGNAIRNVRENADQNLPIVQKYADDIRKRFGIADEKVGEMVARMLQLGMSTRESLTAAMPAIDFAIARNIDLATAADYVAKAHEGVVRNLTLIGAKFTEGADKATIYKEALAFMSQVGLNAAQRQSETLEGSLNKLKESWGELGETVGKFSAQTLKLPAIFDAISWSLDRVAVGSRVAWAALTGGWAGVQQEMINMNLEAVAAGGTLDEAAKKPLKAVSDLGDRVATINANLKAQAELVAAADQAWSEMQEDILSSTTGINQNAETYMANFTITTHMQTAERVKQVHKGVATAQQREFEKALKNVHIKGLSDWKQFANDVKPIFNLTAGSLETAFSSAGYYIAQTLGDTFDVTRLQLRDIWKAMAGDFIKYFINSAIASIAGKFIGFLGSLFDNPVNDAMAGRQGYDFGTYFARAANDAIAATLSPMTGYGGGPSSGAGSPVIVVSGGGNVDLSAIYKDIERAANSKEISVVTRQTLAEAMRSVNAYGRA